MPQTLELVFNSAAKVAGVLGALGTTPSTSCSGWWVPCTALTLRSPRRFPKAPCPMASGAARGRVDADEQAPLASETGAGRGARPTGSPPSSPFPRDAPRPGLLAGSCMGSERGPGAGQRQPLDYVHGFQLWQRPVAERPRCSCCWLRIQNLVLRPNLEWMAGLRRWLRPPPSLRRQCAGRAADALPACRGLPQANAVVIAPAGC